MLRSNFPETILKKAILSLCFGSRLACILKTNPENLSSSGLMNLKSVSLPLGEGEISQNVSNNSLTPKLFTAEPKNTGATSPFK